MGAAREPLEELGAVLLGHAEQVGDDTQRERAGEALDELALTRREEVSRMSSASCHIASSFSLRRLGVISRISRARWLVCVGGSSVGSWSLNGNLVAVLLDQLGDVVTFERDRETRERAGHRDAGRERLRVVVDVDGLLPARHHGHAVVVLAADRALVAKRLVERVRVVRQTTVPEEVDRGQVLRHALLRFDDLA